MIEEKECRPRLQILRNKIMEQFDTITTAEIDEYLILAEEHRGKEMQKDLDIITIKLLSRLLRTSP
jgi:hypothetical protein